MTVIPGHYSTRARGIHSPCAGSNRPYVAGTFQPAWRTAKCAECHMYFKTNTVGHVVRHGARGGA